MLNPIPDEEEIEQIKEVNLIDDNKEEVEEDENSSEGSGESDDDRKKEEDKWELEYDIEYFTKVLGNKKYHLFFFNYIFAHFLVVLLQYSFKADYQENKYSFVYFMIVIELLMTMFLDSFLL